MGETRSAPPRPSARTWPGPRGCCGHSAPSRRTLPAITPPWPPTPSASWPSTPASAAGSCSTSAAGPGSSCGRSGPRARGPSAPTPTAGNWPPAARRNGAASWAARSACRSPSGVVDVCFSANVLEHVPDWRAMLAEMVRVTKPGGIIVVSFTNWLSPWGGHETSPWHYLGGDRAARRYQRRHGRPPKNRFGSSLYPVSVAGGAALGAVRGRHRPGRRRPPLPARLDPARAGHTGTARGRHLEPAAGPAAHRAARAAARPRSPGQGPGPAQPSGVLVSRAGRRAGAGPAGSRRPGRRARAPRPSAARSSPARTSSRRADWSRLTTLARLCGVKLSDAFSSSRRCVTAGVGQGQVLVLDLVQLGPGVRINEVGIGRGVGLGERDRRAAGHAHQRPGHGLRSDPDSR